MRSRLAATRPMVASRVSRPALPRSGSSHFGRARGWLVTSGTPGGRSPRPLFVPRPPQRHQEVFVTLEPHRVETVDARADDIPRVGGGSLPRLGQARAIASEPRHDSA